MEKCDSNKNRQRNIACSRAETGPQKSTPASSNSHSIHLKIPKGPRRRHLCHDSTLISRCGSASAGVILGTKAGRFEGRAGVECAPRRGPPWTGNADVLRWDTSIRIIAVRSPRLPRTATAKNATTRLRRRPWTLRRSHEGINWTQRA